MTTKLAAFFRFTLLYSDMTSIFLLLTLGWSCIDSSWTPLATSVLGFGLSLPFGFVEDGAMEETRVSF